MYSRNLLNCVLVFFVLLANPAFAISPSAALSLDSWVYPALDKLEGLGLIDSSLKGTRPYTRAEVARLIKEARDSASMVNIPRIGQEILIRLEGEFEDQLQETFNSHGGSYLKPLREARFNYVYQKGVPSLYAAQDRFGQKGRIEANQYALNTNNFGLDYAEHHNLHAIFETEARLGGFFLFNWRPLLSVNDEQTQLTTLHASATLGLGPFNLLVGRNSLWWGQGRNGSLILTNNAKPLDMVRVTNPSPFLLPWIFRHLGPFRFDAFLSELEAERYIPNPYLFGMRVTVKPRPWLEIGASRAMMFGGAGQPSVNLSEFVDLFFGKGTNVSPGEENPSNQLAALDARIRLPLIPGAEIYGELGGEDEAGGFISHKAWILGLYLPYLERSGRLALRLEHADLTHKSRIAPYWYRHGTYRSGYTYDQKILGHHVGGAARSSFGEVELRLPGQIILTTGLDVQVRGTDQDVREKHLMPFWGATWFFGDNVQTSAHYALDRVTNVGFQRDEDRTDHFAHLSLSFVW